MECLSRSGGTSGDRHPYQQVQHPEKVVVTTFTGRRRRMDLQQLLMSEDTKMRALSASTSNRIVGFETILNRGASFLQYAQRVMEMHWRLIERWGGWSTTVPDVPVAIGAGTTTWLTKELWDGGDLYLAAHKLRETEAFSELLVAVGRDPVPDKTSKPTKREHYDLSPDFTVGFVGKTRITAPCWGSEVGFRPAHEQSEAYVSALLTKDVPTQLTGTTRTRSLEAKPSDRLVVRVLQVRDHAMGNNVSLYVPVRPGQKWTSAVLPAVGALAPCLLKDFERFFTEVQRRIWDAAQELADIKLTCSPCAFLLLGALGERNSCYNGSNSWCKLFLGTDVPDSFLILYRMQRDGRKGWVRPSARAWGIATPQGALLSNFYLMPQTALEEATKMALAQAIGLRLPLEVFKNWNILMKMFTAVAKDNTLYTNGDVTLFHQENQCSEMQDYITSLLDVGAKHGRFAAQGHGGARPISAEALGSFPYAQALATAINSTGLQLLNKDGAMLRRRTRVTLEEAAP